VRVPTDVLSMLKDYQSWAAGKSDFDLLDYVACVATPDLFFGFGELFFPEVVLHDGNYFLASDFRASTYNEWLVRLKDPIAVQKVMNHVHISTLIQQQVVPDLVALEVAKHLAACWSVSLADKGLVAEAYGETFEDLEVTFFRRAK